MAHAYQRLALITPSYDPLFSMVTHGVNILYRVVSMGLKKKRRRLCLIRARGSACIWKGRAIGSTSSSLVFRCAFTRFPWLACPWESYIFRAADTILRPQPDSSAALVQSSVIFSPWHSRPWSQLHSSSCKMCWPQVTFNARS